MSKTITLYKCDECERLITEPTGGLVIHGNIYVADPSERGGLIGNNFPTAPFMHKVPDNIESVVKETVLCVPCFMRTVLPEKKLSLTRGLPDYD